MAKNLTGPVKTAKYILRDYQQKAVGCAIVYFENGKDSGLMVLPTGSGKSLVIAEIAKKLNGHVLVFQPTKEILEQNYEKYLSYGGLAGIYSASIGVKEICPVTFATIGSVFRKPDLFSHFQYIIIDECHGVNAKNGMYKTFLNNIGDKKLLGLTATPYRLNTDGYGGSMLKFLTRTRPRIFKELIYYSQISDLAEKGYLAKIDYYPIKSMDATKLQLNSTGADYTDKSVIEHYKAINLSSQLLNVTQRLMKKRDSILVFTRFVEEATKLVEKIGSNAEIVTAITPKKERQSIIERFRSGKTNVVANVGVLTVGFDYPELSTVLLARPTRSLALYYQMIGRAIRPHKTKDSAWVIDMGDSYRRFGKIEDLRLTCSKPKLWHIESNNRQLTNVYYY